MPNVRATCLLCTEPVEVPAAEVVLHLQETSGLSRYGFSCPECEAFTVRRANRAIVETLLRTDDVEVVMDTLPPWETSQGPDVVIGEIGPATGRPAGDHDTRTAAPPLTEADVLLFRKALEDDAILAAWLAD